MSKLTIRQAQPDVNDVVALVRLGDYMAQESNFANLEYDRYLFGEFVFDLLFSEGGAAFLAEKDGETVGGILCTVSRFMGGPDTVANELGLFVRQDRRGSRAAVGLVGAYKNWALSRGAKRISAGNSAGADDTVYVKLLSHAGFQQAGSLMYLNVD